MSLPADIKIILATMVFLCLHNLIKITDNAIPTGTRILLQAIKAFTSIFATFCPEFPLYVRQDVHRLEMRVKAVVSAQTGLLGDWWDQWWPSERLSSSKESSAAVQTEELIAAKEPAHRSKTCIVESGIFGLMDRSRVVLSQESLPNDCWPVLNLWKLQRHTWYRKW